MRIAVFLPGWVGDVVMATPALRALRRLGAVVGRRRLHLGDDVYFSVRSLALYDDHEVAEAVVGPVEP